MKSTISWICFALGALLVSAVDAADDPRRKQLMTGEEVSLSAWTRDLKSIANSYKPKTELDRDDEMKKVKDRIAKSLDNKVLKLTGQLKEIQWKDEVGMLTVNMAGQGDTGFIKAHIIYGFDIKIGKEEAKKLRKGQKFEIRAVAEFKSGTVYGPNQKSQQLHTIQTGTGLIVGTFVTQVYEITINDKVYDGYWDAK